MWRALLLLMPSVAGADSLVATRIIRAQETIAADAVTLVAAEIPQALTDPAQALGQEARVAIYPGRAIRADQIGPAALVERNQIVTLIYQTAGLAISTEGRALARAGEGEAIEVMNLASKTKVIGRVGPDGHVTVGPIPTP